MSARSTRGRTATKGSLPIVVEDDRTALSARWPEPVLHLSDEERELRVRSGLDTVILDEIQDGKRTRRGFVRAVLKVPLGHPRATVYGVFVEVDKDAYLALRDAFQNKAAVRVHGRLATRLPLLEDAYGTDVEIVEDGSDLRARVEMAASRLITEGPVVGPR